MQTDRWRQISGLYHAVLERPPEERLGFLKENCKGDDDLYREVEGFLAQGNVTSGLFPSPSLSSDLLPPFTSCNDLVVTTASKRSRCRRHGPSKPSPRHPPEPFVAIKFLHPRGRPTRTARVDSSRRHALLRRSITPTSSSYTKSALTKISTTS